MAGTAPTIISIARELKLANTTVSEILRGKPGYNGETRQRVLGAAKRMGYRPNYLSRALVGSKSKSIGIFAGISETLAVAKMIADVELAARRNGYLSYLVDYGIGTEDELATHLQNLLDRRIDALIVHQTTDFLPAPVEKLLGECGLPVVRLGSMHPVSTPTVWIDRYQAAHQLAEHLAGLGHRETALILGEYGHRHPEQKLHPLSQAMSEFGIKLDCSKRWTIGAGREYDYGCLELIKREILAGDLPTALLFSSDRFAVEAYAALHDAGLSVPRDVSIVGFDDDHYASVLRPTLTTIRQPRTEIGRAAFNMLLTLMNNPDAKIPNQKVSCELVIRDSTGPVRNRLI
jgi:DNA-binding LacI/PurR family transcriptional regulator